MRGTTVYNMRGTTALLGIAFMLFIVFSGCTSSTRSIAFHNMGDKVYLLECDEITKNPENVYRCKGTYPEKTDNVVYFRLRQQPFNDKFEEVNE